MLGQAFNGRKEICKNVALATELAIDLEGLQQLGFIGGDRWI